MPGAGERREHCAVSCRVWCSVKSRTASQLGRDRSAASNQRRRRPMITVADCDQSAARAVSCGTCTVARRAFAHPSSSRVLLERVGVGITPAFERAGPVRAPFLDAPGPMTHLT